MSEWKEYKLREVIDQFIDYRGKTPPKTDSGIPLITAKIIKGGRILEPNEFIAKEYYEQWMTRGYPEINDVILTTEAPLGEVALLKNKNVALAQRIITLRGKKELCDNAFLKYYLQSSIGQATLQSRAQGSTVEGIKSAELREMEVMLPDLPEQKSIASILSSLDDKIDLLHRQNKTLEALAETLFRQWFVEEAEEGWEVGSMENEFDITMGQSPPGSSYNEDGTGHVFFQGRTDFGFRFPEPRVYTTEPKRLAKRLDTLVSVRAPVGDMNMALQDCCLGRGVAAFRYKYNPSFTTYTHYKLRSLMAQIKQFEDNGTVFGSIGKDDFKKLENIIPPKDLIQTFQSEAAPLDDKILKNTIQIRTLSRLRDTLLPKLMSGEVRIKLKQEGTGI